MTSEEIIGIQASMIAELTKKNAEFLQGSKVIVDDCSSDALRETIFMLQKRIDDLEQKNKELPELKKTINNLTKQNNNLTQQNNDLTQQICNLELEIQTKVDELSMITNSKSWRFTRIFRLILWKIKGN